MYFLYYFLYCSNPLNCNTADVFVFLICGILRFTTTDVYHSQAPLILRKHVPFSLFDELMVCNIFVQSTCFAFSINYRILTTTVYCDVHVLHTDYRVRRTLEFVADYTVDCTVVNSPVASNLLEDVAKQAYSIIKTLCGTGNK